MNGSALTPSWVALEPTDGAPSHSRDNEGPPRVIEAGPPAELLAVLQAHTSRPERVVVVTREAFGAVPGLGDASFAAVQAALELGRRYLEARLRRGTPLGSPADTRRFLIARLRCHEHEVFACLFLDTRHRVIAFEELFHGTIDGATVYPRVVAEKALHHGAAALIVAHNHPSGVSEPSLADQAITRRLKSALALLDIRLLDHFVIGDGRAVSMAARGML